MKFKAFIASLLLLCFAILLHGSAPTADNGRFRPMETFARDWLQEIYGKPALKKSDLPAFHQKNRQALPLLWQMQFHGHHAFDDAPLFYIPKAEDKKALGLELKKDRFSYREVMRSSTIPESIQPLIQRYEAKDRFYALPSRRGKGIWLPLSALESESNQSLYSNALWNNLRAAYQKQDVDTLAALLNDGYASLEGKTYLKARGKSLRYPTQNQLALEALYLRYPFTLITAVLYAAAIICLLLYPRAGIALTAIAFILHTLLLAARIYILERPPVSNMFETVLYVPWISVLAALLMRNRTALIAACMGTIALLLILQLSGLSSSMENVQAVLDSQYWLIVHVLMVVGSYGLFIVAGILGHLYLFKWLRSREETPPMRDLSKTLLHTLYFGVALLIPGTILGGVWAAQSWGRFWDWDPKESWAFISSCVYLIVIHAYTFRKIASFGLAIGSIAGLLAISFTWYGVNYILGTGLHSYGFGSGGELWYGAYILVEVLFLTALLVEKNYCFMVNSAPLKKIKR